jgi:hypothetical protein
LANVQSIRGGDQTRSTRGSGHHPQRLVLHLTDALSTDVELLADLVERLFIAKAHAVPKAQHARDDRASESWWRTR